MPFCRDRLFSGSQTGTPTRARMAEASCGLWHAPRLRELLRVGTPLLVP
jgi:hypothetical protein